VFPVKNVMVSGGLDEPELFYSESKNEKEDYRRTHYFARDSGNGEEVDRTRAADGFEEMRGVWRVVYTANGPAIGGRSVLGVPAIEDQRLA
jgi:hypothetical protein